MFRSYETNGGPGAPTMISKPWGYELIWAHTDKYVGKVLHINKGHSLSYQYHRVKDETISLLTGSLELVVAWANEPALTRILAPGDCFHIPPGLRHQMHALDECQVLEASTPHLDDIVRLEDPYGRV